MRKADRDPLVAKLQAEGKAEFTIDHTKVVWMPQAGSQMNFLACPVPEVLFEGTRGPGKTDSLLMDFEKDTGKGYGAAWKGILFRQTYKQLTDVISKSQKWFPQTGKNPVFNHSEHYWKWPTGEVLLFRQFRRVSDYDNYHGHEYCLAAGERVPLQRGHTSIEDVIVGDMIATPVGWRRVNRTFNMGIKPCVKVSGHSVDGNLYFEQRQATSHRLLTNEQLFQPQSPRVLNTVLRYAGNFYPGELDGKFQIDEYQGSRSSGVGEQCFENVGTGMSRIYQEPLPRTFGRVFSAWLGRAPWLVKSVSSRTPIPRHNTGKPSERWLDCMGCPPLFLRGWLRTAISHLPVLGSFPSNQNVLKLCDHYVTKITEDCRGGYSPDHDPCGERFPMDTENGQSVPQPWPCADQPINLKGDQGLFAGRIQRDPISFQHPYDEGKLVQSAVELESCFLDVQACGSLPCFDIEVDDVNSYHTSNGLVNSNCWIGWEELCNWSNDEGYKKMFSTNRTSVKGVPKRIRSTANPYGPGHNWVKARFRLPGSRYQLIDDSYDEDGKLEPPRMAIHGYLEENLILLAADPDYISNIRASATSDAELQAWLHGSWDIVAGGMFDDVWSASYNVVVPFDIPATWRIDRSFDWGSSAPFSVGWWARSDGSDVRLRDGTIRSTVRGDLFRVAEWYGWTGKPNKGLKMAATDITKGIIERELKWGWRTGNISRVKAGVADSAIYAVQDRHSIAASMQKPIRINGTKFKGIQWIASDKGAGSRKTGWQVMREWLSNAHPNDDGTPREHAGLFVFDTCKQFLRTIPVLPRDDKDMDDVDTDAEDHIADEVRYKIRSLGKLGRSGKTNQRDY